MLISNSQRDSHLIGENETLPATLDSLKKELRAEMIEHALTETASQPD